MSLSKILSQALEHISGRNTPGYWLQPSRQDADRIKDSGYRLNQKWQCPSQAFRRRTPAEDESSREHSHCPAHQQQIGEQEGSTHPENQKVEGIKEVRQRAQ